MTTASRRRPTKTSKSTRGTGSRKYDPLEARRLFADVLNQKKPELFGRARLKSAQALVASVCTAAKKAGFKVSEREDGEWIILGSQGLLSIKAYMNAGIVIEMRSDGVTHDIGAAHIEYDPLDDIWVGTRDGQHGRRMTAVEAVAHRLAEGLRNI